MGSTEEIGLGLDGVGRRGARRGWEMKTMKMMQCGVAMVEKRISAEVNGVS